MEAYFELYRAKDRVVGDMPEPQFRILLDLTANGPKSTTALSYAPTTTTLRHLGELVGQGWIERGDDPSDRRKTTYRMTRQGLDLMDGLHPAEHKD